MAGRAHHRGEPLAGAVRGRPPLRASARRPAGERALPAKRLELEITEGLLLSDSESVMRQLGELKGLGVRIAMDDFGTGYSSAQLPVAFPLRQAQDRPIVRAGARRR